MCGRFALITPGDALIADFEIESTSLDMAQITPRYNVAPTQPVLAVRATAVNN